MFGQWLRAPRQLRLVFIATMLLLSGTLGWLAWRLLDQDQQLLLQRLAEQRDTAADLVVAAMEKRLTAVEQDLDHVPAADSSKRLAQAEGAIVFQFLPDVIRAWPENRLIYYPELPHQPETPPALFAASEELEFKNHDYPGAIAALREAASSNDSKVRAAALVRIARNYAKAGQPRESIETYQGLANLGAVTVGGLPAALAASLAILGQQAEPPARLDAARSLYRDLNSGNWPISFAAYQYLSGEVALALPEAERPAPARLALAEGVEWLWERWHPARDSAALSANRASVPTSTGAVLLVWRIAGGEIHGFAADTGYLEKHWLADLKPLLDSRGVRLFLTNPDGRRVVGEPPSSGSRAAVRLASVTQLPWTLQVFQTSDGGGAWQSRRALLVAGIAVLLALILTGGWFIGRTVEHELAVAKLQSDFESTVSHEFRTPLTSLCQLSELLMRGRVAGEQDRQQYYEALHGESHRLRRLVEALLNFGRLDAGKLQFHFEKLDAAVFLRQSAAEFAQGQQAHGHRIEVETHAASSLIHADRETLRCVFWNLLENAVKYSPDCDTVWVELTKKGRQVEVAVRDRGVGIPRHEQRRIFEKFVRGSAERESGIRGTGIGLAMARQIVRAHGGDVSLESEPGKGSTFRVLLPEREA